MKKLLMGVLFSIMLLTLNACTETNKIGTEETKSATVEMEKNETTPKKCSADGKCGEGKCGDSKTGNTVPSE
ncbi:MAG: hypothetical protein COA92_10110 [Sulfurovum sp.]|nr:MAG: hypothetical protein COA92_10110 [Sulfurovum sp.]